VALDDFSTTCSGTKDAIEGSNAFNVGVRGPGRVSAGETPMEVYLVD
jgi:hypothetical protein